MEFDILKIDPNDMNHDHAVTEMGSDTYSYDADGNQTQRVVGGNTYNLTYDAENRLVGVSGYVTATIVYDGDGNRVKATIGTTTTYVGNYFEWISSTSNMKKYYYEGNIKVAMRTGSGTLNYLLGDHLGSQAITTSSGGVRTADVRYYPWGTERYTYGTTPTTYHFTGQRLEGSLGLYFYGARWLDPAAGRFIQADTVIPDPGNPLDWDRYSYVRNNPIRYKDPSGHTSVCGYSYSDPECPGNAPKPHQTFDERYGLTFTGEGWTDRTRAIVRQAAFDSGVALAREQTGMTFEEAFRQEYSEGIELEWTTNDSRLRTDAQNANPACNNNFAGDCAAGGGFTESSTHILFASLSNGIYGVRNVVHEFGHAYRKGVPATNMPGWIVQKRSDILRPNDGPLNWQQNTAKTPSETFADMFIAWVYSAWNTVPANSGWVNDAQTWMNGQMP